jgi:TRAP-type uncharacterized transport system substrate-binding protein
MEKVMKAIMVVGLLLAGSSAAMAAEPTHFKLCTGNQALNYYKAGHLFKKQSTSVIVDVIETKGSLDNLDKLSSGECDGAFVQNDAMLVYSQKNASAISGMERAGVLYQEQAHMLCNRGPNLGRMVSLTKDMTVAIGPDGSGSNTTWAGFVMADKKRYGVVNTDTRSGVRALSAIADGTQVTCMLVITALNSSFMKNDAQQLGDKLVLVGTDDRDMEHTKDARGKTIYDYGEIPADTYPKIQPSGSVYGTKAVETIKLDAIFVASTKWINDHDADYDKLLRAFAAARPEIGKLAQPTN